jgi:hypothetical protein
VDREQRQAQNEALYRATNPEIERASEALGGGAESEFEVLCECGREGCGAVLLLRASKRPTGVVAFDV